MDELRKQYTLDGLDESDISSDPFVQFDKWFSDARIKITDSWFEPNAMALATCDKSGEVSNRIVLLKGVDEIGFRFFTNYSSLKASDIAANPKASLLFFWPQLERQIRIVGNVKKTSEELSDKYFNSRPLKSRISATVSPQSKPVSGRKVLEDAVVALEKSIAEKQQNESSVDSPEIERPEFWGGYHVIPTTFEFWQGRENRLHDRLQYNLEVPGTNQTKWNVSRLGP